jgi:stage IV sporulation protein B
MHDLKKLSMAALFIGLFNLFLIFSFFPKYIQLLDNEKIGNTEEVVQADNIEKITELVPLGMAVGIKINTDGVVAFGTGLINNIARDSTQGIGTITYYNPLTDKFGALGHGILDANTKDLMAIKEGQLMPSKIQEVKKGKRGIPGELIGDIEEGSILGNIRLNTDHGIYGFLNEETLSMPKALPIAKRDEVNVGIAKIFSDVEGGNVKAYDVYIENINKNDTDNSKGMVVKITDERLLSKTNGIVQGMSGSPIIQNGKICGAITHVFVQDPTKGYGIFIESMLKQENGV